MRRCALILLTMICVSASAQKPIRIYSTYAESHAATQLQDFLEKGGCKTAFGGKNPGQTIYIGLTIEERRGRYNALYDSLCIDGYAIVGDGRNVHLFGKGEKGTLYAAYAFLEMLGYRLYTPDALVVPDVSSLHLPNCCIVSNPAFEWREVSYYYPNHSQLYADWHHLHTLLDREGLFGMFVHTFNRLLPPDYYYGRHPEWYSLNNGRRSRDGQLCLSNPEVLDSLCASLEECISIASDKKIWSVSPNDNYNVCECDNCRRLDSLYGGPSGTLIWFVNQVARRFPDKTIATLAYQYTRKAPTSNIKPDSNVLVMLCPIEAGRQAPIYKTDPAFRKDMEDWHRLTDNLFLWDYVVQFRNFWNPFPNLHVLQPNLQYFRDNGVRMMFEQASGANNITSWMDIRCYMIAKLLWNPDADMDSIMSDLYQGYYGDAGRYVKEIIDTMTAALIASGQTLNIYGFPVDGFEGYLSVERMHQYDSLMDKAHEKVDSVIRKRLDFFKMALDFARVDLAASVDLQGYTGKEDDLIEAAKNYYDRLNKLVSDLQAFDVKILMEMGISPKEYFAVMDHWIDKMFDNRTFFRTVTLRKSATPPYNHEYQFGGGQVLTDGVGGIMDYRHDWLGFWGDTLDATITLGDTKDFTSVRLDFYFYPLSWIFLPQHVALYISDDGEMWKQIYETHPVNPKVLATPDIQTVSFESDTPLNARYLRVEAEPIPEIPSWHRAAGQKAWIFTDEIIVK